MKRLFVLLAVSAAAVFAQGGAASPDDLLRQVFAALAQKDSAALQQLSISQEEFKKFVWPAITPAPTGSNAEKFSKTYSASSGVGSDDSLKQYGRYKVATYYVRPQGTDTASK